MSHTGAEGRHHHEKMNSTRTTGTDDQDNSPAHLPLTFFLPQDTRPTPRSLLRHRSHIIRPPRLTRKRQKQPMPRPILFKMEHDPPIPMRAVRISRHGPLILVHVVQVPVFPVSMRFGVFRSKEVDGCFFRDGSVEERGEGVDDVGGFLRGVVREENPFLRYEQALVAEIIQARGGIFHRMESMYLVSSRFICLIWKSSPSRVATTSTFNV